MSYTIGNFPDPAALLAEAKKIGDSAYSVYGAVTGQKTAAQQPQAQQQQQQQQQNQTPPGSQPPPATYKQPSFLDDLALQTGLSVPILIAIGAAGGYFLYMESQKKKGKG